MKNLIDNPMKEEARILKFSSTPLPKRRIKSVQVADAFTGEIISESTRPIVSQNGSGWVISYTEKMCEFLTKVTSPTVIRLFLILAHRQNYGTNGIYGYRCTKKYLRELLRVDRKTIYDALEYLKANFLVVENRFDGQTEFMVNPEYVTIGTDKKARLREWSQRWEFYFKNRK